MQAGGDEVDGVGALTVPEAIDLDEVGGVKRDKRGNVTHIFPAFMVEAMLADCLREVKASVDVLYKFVEDEDSFTENAPLTWVILKEFCLDAEQKLKPYSDAALKPKHRYCREVIKSMLERLADNMPMREDDDFDLSTFAGDVVAFLSAFHFCLSEGTTEKQRRAEKELFCGPPIQVH